LVQESEEDDGVELVLEAELEEEAESDHETEVASDNDEALSVGATRCAQEGDEHVAKKQKLDISASKVSLN
jgi:hypothetical protein